MPFRSTALACVAAACLPGAAVAGEPANDQRIGAMTVFHQERNFLKLGTLNLTTGGYTPDSSATIEFPSSHGCTWVPLEGTEGRGTTTFHANRSYFFLAQQTCDGQLNQTVLSATRIPMYQDDADFLYNDSSVLSHSSRPADAAANANAKDENGNLTVVHSFPGSDYRMPLDSWNLVWDHACNLIVVAPRQKFADEMVYETWMISEYDAQARQQADLVDIDLHAKGWAKVAGLGALDTYSVSTGGPWQWNCGDNCSFFSLERKQYDPRSPSRIVGRNFHTGKVLSNISNTLNVQQLTSPSEDYMPSYYDFLMLGLGICDDGSSGGSVCDNHPGSIVLVGYGGAGEGRLPLTALASVVPASDVSKANETLRLGVVMEAHMWPQPGQPVKVNAYVYVDGAIVTYEVSSTTTADGSRGWEAKKVGESPTSTVAPPTAWTIGPYNMW